MDGTLIPVVGPSGAGKDTLIDAARVARPDIYFPERVITRPASAGGEVFCGVETSVFNHMINQGAFAFHWQAHGLFYGIPIEIVSALAAGQHVIFNGSRGVIDAARARFKNLRVLVVTAPHEVLAQRLAQRGRESAADIAKRLTRATYAPPIGADVFTVQNDKPLADSTAAFLAALPVKQIAHSDQ